MYSNKLFHSLAFFSSIVDILSVYSFKYLVRNLLSWQELYISYSKYIFCELSTRKLKLYSLQTTSMFCKSSDLSSLCFLVTVPMKDDNGLTNVSGDWRTSYLSSETTRHNMSTYFSSHYLLCRYLLFKSSLSYRSIVPLTM